MRAAWRGVAAFALSICLVACGGGGSSSSGTSSGSDSDFGTAVTLQFSPDLPAVVGASSTTEIKILAVDAKGVTRDVTAVAQVRVDAPNRLTTTISGSNLQLQFLQNPGPPALRSMAKNALYIGGEHDWASDLADARHAESVWHALLGGLCASASMYRGASMPGTHTSCAATQ